ncbi:MAG: 50S ribosomal protein L25, partial [Treponema sp.]|nr:50S ribosomal protein L25 [Treponema sp.]
KNRQETGSAVARRLRRNGRIPGVLYGRTGQSVPLDMDELEFTRGIKGITESTILKVDVDGKSHDVLVKNTQRNIMDGRIQHIDFYEVEADVCIRAKIVLVIHGNPVGVREGGVLEVPLNNIEVECLPKDMPERISVDISDLKIGQSIHVRDLPLGDGVRLLSQPDKVVVLVKFAKGAAAAAAAEAAAAEKK